jgi:diguanylate cyclase (GGDEF)-like protein
MQFFSIETGQIFLRRIILPLAALVSGLLVFAIAGIFWIADYQTRIAIEQQVRLANGAFRIQAEKLATSAADYGFWDDAVTSIVDRPDPAWMSENIGAGAEKSLGIEMAFALDAQGVPVYTYAFGKESRLSPAHYLGEGFDRVLANWKKGPPAKTYAGLLPYKDTAVSIAIAPIRSFTQADRPATGYALVFVDIVDPPLLRQLARDFELANLRLVRSDEDIADQIAAIEISDPSGHAGSRFAWDPLRPGNGLLRIALPFMACLILLVVIFGGVTLNYVALSARLITDREKKASRDPLTGLANRTLFFTHLDKALEKTSPGINWVAVMYVDLDGFKSINDTMGHAAGDELLVQAASRFRACVRDSDLVARLGGDEFAIILSGKGDRNQTQAVGARILLAMSEPFQLAAGVAQTSCSIGIADASDGAIRGADILNRADRALYEAKASGKNAMRFAPNTAPEICRPQAPAARVA